MRRQLWLVPAALVLGGCGSFAADMKMMCDAPKHVSPVGISTSERAMLLSQHIAENTKSRDARELFQALATVPPDDRGRLLEDAVKRAGIETADCAILKEYQ